MRKAQIAAVAPASRADYAEMLDRELPQQPPDPVGMRLGEFFCCGGGIGLGFRSAGYRLVFANDRDPQAAATYAKNLGHEPVVRDVREVASGEVPQVDVLTGGFPCVTFSTAGKRLGVTDDINGKLYLELCRLIGECRPKYFVAENVKGILSANGGAAVKLVLAAFLRLGYRTRYELVNMAEHGVPQTRQRVIFVGVRLDQWRGEFRFPQKTHRLREDKKAARWLPEAISLLRAIGDLPPPGEELVGNMHGDAASKRERGSGAGVSGYHSSQPRRHDEPAHSQPRRHDEPAHSQTTSANALIVRTNNHDPNNLRPHPKYAMASRVAPLDSPSPSQVSAEISTPFIRGARNDDFSNPLVDSGRPSPTVVSSEPPQLSIRNDVTGIASKVAGLRSMRERSAETPMNTMRSTDTDDFRLTTTDGLRRMTVRECARVQSFPDWYEFQGTQADGYRQVGNAVPPLYAKRLALALAEYDERTPI